MAASTSFSNFEVYCGPWQSTLAVLWLQPSLQLGLTIVMLFYAVHRHKSPAICRWCWTPPPVWLLVRESLTHVTPVLRDVLYWLPVPQQIQFKIALTAFDCVRGSGPAYFTDVCIPVANISSRSNLRSAQYGDMVVLRTRNQLCQECPPCLPPLNIHQSRTIQNWKPISSTKPTTSSENILF